MSLNIIENCLKPVVVSEYKIFPCGQCPICRRKRMAEWQVRAGHELITAKKATFLTLTYKTKYLRIEAYKKENEYDQRGNLKPEDMTLFIKRLRKKLGNTKIRYIYCGEYGEKKWRPHYHMIVYGLSPEELERLEVEKIWKLGHVDISPMEATNNSISYILGYARKKVVNKLTQYKEYKSNGRVPPFQRQSQGIGKEWAIKNAEDWTKTLECAFREHQVSIPRYYIKTIYKLEGRTIKWTSEIIRMKGNIETRKNYKVIVNIAGKLTQRIIERRIYKQNERLDDWENKYEDIDIFTVQILRRKEKDQLFEEISNKVKDYQDYWTMSDYKIQKRLHKRTKEADELDKKGRPEKEITWLFEKDLEILQKRATQKAYEILNGAFGKRDKLEKIEEIIGL